VLDDEAVLVWGLGEDMCIVAAASTDSRLDRTSLGVGVRLDKSTCTGPSVSEEIAGEVVLDDNTDPTVWGRVVAVSEEAVFSGNGDMASEGMVTGVALSCKESARLEEAVGAGDIGSERVVTEASLSWKESARLGGMVTEVVPSCKAVGAELSGIGNIGVSEGMVNVEEETAS